MTHPKIDMTTLPARMQSLPIDERGYVTPWFVAMVDGKPEFRAMDPRKFIEAVRSKLCWVCGQKMGFNMAFVAGPMCGVNRTSSEPPCHYECATWSSKNCPFLANPRMVRREDEVINNQSLRENAAGCAITRNPGVAMVWVTRQYETWKAPGGFLIQMGDPEKVEWWREGREATYAEVLESFESGLPNLINIARQEEGGIAALNRAVERFQKYMPAMVTL